MIRYSERDIGKRQDSPGLELQGVRRYLIGGRDQAATWPPLDYRITVTRNSRVQLVRVLLILKPIVSGNIHMAIPPYREQGCCRSRGSPSSPVAPAGLGARCFCSRLSCSTPKISRRGSARPDRREARPPWPPLWRLFGLLPRCICPGDRTGASCVSTDAAGPGSMCRGQRFRRNSAAMTGSWTQRWDAPATPAKR